jgi:hypothetical protein
MENALRLPGPERYEYFVKRVADCGALYGLQSAAGWALAGDEMGPRILPVWPHERFAELCKKGDWSDCTVVKIPLAEWFDELSKTLIAKSMGVAVFKLPEGRGVVVDPECLSNDLKEELSQMEDDE